MSARAVIIIAIAATGVLMMRDSSENFAPIGLLGHD